MQNFLRLQLFLSLFFGTFLTCAGGIWLYENRAWLGHQYNRITARPSFKIPTGPIPGLPTEPLIKLPSNTDWQKNWTQPKITIPQLKFSPPKVPQMPQIPMPRISPRPPMGIRR